MGSSARLERSERQMNEYDDEEEWRNKKKKKQNMSKTSSRLDRIIMQAICIWTRCDASFYANFRCEKIEWDPCVCVCVINMYFMGAWMSCSKLWFRFSVARLHSREAQTKTKNQTTPAAKRYLSSSSLSVDLSGYSRGRLYHTLS